MDKYFELELIFCAVAAECIRNHVTGITTSSSDSETGRQVHLPR